MFKKPYKIKTSTTIKGSDRRRLRTLAETSFSGLSSNDINSLISNKGDMNQVKALTHSGVVTMIYYSKTNPIFFQIENTCYPTVYTLWKFPNILPTITTIPPVWEKISNGADLMAPGIVIDESTLQDMENIEVKGMCAVRILGNKAPIAVGVVLMSKEELCVDGVKGKAVNIVHIYQDTLYLSGDQKSLPIVDESYENELIDVVKDIEITEDNSPSAMIINDLAVEENSVESSNVVNDDSSLNEVDIVPVASKYSPDEVLHNSFFTALKVFGKKLELPVLTSTFYSSRVLKCCPDEFNLDIKKTSYKKLSIFLKKMQKENILQIKELTKGVESIVSVNLENDLIKNFCIDALFKNHLQSEKEKEKSVVQEPSSSIQCNYRFPVVTELFVVSAQVKILFEKFQVKKGDTISGVKVRDVLKQYVKENNLQSPSNPRDVLLDPILADCALKKGQNDSTMKWEELFDSVISKMPHAFQIEFENKDPIVKKGKLEPINVLIDTRTANKKVTLVHNLETYGINPEKLAQHVQVAVAASTSIVPTQGGKGTHVLIQGNQIRYLQKLFLEIYKVPRKYLQGLDNVPKKK